MACNSQGASGWPHASQGSAMYIPFLSLYLSPGLALLDVLIGMSIRRLMASIHCNCRQEIPMLMGDCCCKCSLLKTVAGIKTDRLNYSLISTCVPELPSHYELHRNYPPTMSCVPEPSHHVLCTAYVLWRNYLF